MSHPTMKIQPLVPLALAVLMLALAGCATNRYSRQPYPGDTYGTTYQNRADYGRGAARSCPASQCGVVRDIRQVYVQDGNNSHALGTIIGVLAGAALGHTVGKGDGRTAATVAGAVAGGAVGNQVAKRNSGNQVPAWQIVVKLDDGRIATVTQREDPNVRPGDYVLINNGQVYMH